MLLDVGGVFFLPLRAHIRSALQQCGHTIEDDRAIDRAHYEATRVFPMDLTDSDTTPYWDRYLEAYSLSLGVDSSKIAEAVDHLRDTYRAGGLWNEVVGGAKSGLRKLAATGVLVGIVSNANGTIAERLRARRILQVGPGEGVSVGCVVDSGRVGVEKPDPRIFAYAFDALEVAPEDTWYVGDTPAFDVVGARRAGTHPILMDPFDVHRDVAVHRVRSVGEVADLVTIRGSD